MEELFNSYKKIVYRAVAVGLISEEAKMDYLSAIMQDRPLREPNISKTEKKTSAVTPVKYYFLSPERSSNHEPLNTSGTCGMFKKLNANGSGSYVILTETSPTEEKRGFDSSNFIMMPKIKETINKNSSLLISVIKSNMTGSENNISPSFDSKNSTHVLMAAKDKLICNDRIDFGVPIYMNVVTKKCRKRKSCKKRGERAFNYGKNELKPRIYEESETMETDYDSFSKINENNRHFKNTLSHKQHISRNTSPIEVNSKKSAFSGRFRFVKENDHFSSKYSDNELEDKNGANTGEAKTVARKLDLEKTLRLKNKEFKPRRMAQDLETLEMDDDCLPKANAKNKNFKRVLILKPHKSRDTSLLKSSFRKPSIIENLDMADADNVPSSKRIERRRNYKKSSNPKQHKLRNAQFVKRGFRKYIDFNSPALYMEDKQFLNEGYSDDNSNYELETKEGEKIVRQALKYRNKSKASTKMNELHPLKDNENKFSDENTADKKSRNSPSQMFCSKLLHNFDERDKVVNIKIVYQFFPREISRVCNEEGKNENKMGPESKQVEKKEIPKKAARYLSRFFRKQS